MNWTDNAIILTTRKHGESAGVVSLISAQHGLFKGLVRGISGKKQCGIYQSGNMVEATWKGRLSEHLGSFSAELVKSNSAHVMSCRQRLAALNSICCLLDQTLSEREPSPLIFGRLVAFIEALTEDSNWQLNYVLIEMELLSHLGFGLDISECAATGVTEGLAYISPKSGRAVCAEAGRPYHDKLFKMPSFLQNDNDNADLQEIKNGLDICSYFLDKYIFQPHNMKLPVARMRFAEVMNAETCHAELVSASSFE